MKTPRLLTTAVLLTLFLASASAQFNRTVYGSGKVVTKDRQAGSFSELKVSSGIDVFLRQGASESIKVEADDNLHEYILTEIRNGALNVYSDNVNIRKAEKQRVYVTMKDISRITVSSAGDVVGESPVRAGNLKINVSSAGDVRLEVYTKDLEIDISSSGNVTLTGESDIMEADLSSAGDLNAWDLKVREADLSVSSAGDANVNVSERLTARASSAGDINYTGNPKFLDAHSSSAGGIHRK
ncbi:MAG: DUF2807 domain-containing protein [Bacteroidales bacterium]|nr:DUF2807 domain-containing protein [Bacteroidales bacterium]MCU0409440.1 DUF2807 domain-containing protein [Bacteroidales bacterium]